MFAIVVRFNLRDADAADEFDQVVAELVTQIEAHEPGTLVYATHTVDGDPLARVFYELYADRAAHAAHEQQPHTAVFLADRDRWVTSFRVEFLGDGPAKGLPA